MIRLALALCWLPAIAAAEPVKSGVAVGQRPGPYSFIVATGPERGRQTCYICEQAAKPAVVVFARTLSDPLGKLVAKLDAEMPARKESGFKAWMTLLAPKADLDGVAKWSKAEGLSNAPVGVFEDVDGPPSYKLHGDADVTVLFFVNEKVVANFAFREGELTEAKIPSVMKALPALFADKRPPRE